MLIIAGALVAFLMLRFFARARVPGRVNAANLGWMSERWVAEYRAAHRT